MRPRLTVSLASETGPVFHGASGALYGLSEDGAPHADLLAPLHVRSIAQKPPGGLQHPTGDADKVAPGFLGAGGERILVYLQDIYPDWPYQDNGIADYLIKVTSVVSYLADQPYHRQVAFVPFNEPDWIWYDLKTTDQAQYIANRPHTGRYLLSVYYGNQTQDIAQQILRVDDQPWSFISYPPTLNAAFRSHQDRYLNLTAGSHAITFGVSDPAIGTARGRVTLNIIKLAYAPAAIPGVTHPAGHYPAASADLSGGATVGYGGHLDGRSGPGYVMTPAGSGVAFVVQADHDGYYALRLRYATETPGPVAGFTLLVGAAALP